MNPVLLEQSNLTFNMWNGINLLHYQVGKSFSKIFNMPQNTRVFLCKLNINVFIITLANLVTHHFDGNNV